MAFIKKVDVSGGEQFKFERVGQSLEGYYVGSFDHEGDYGPTKKHIFQTEKGIRVVFGQKHLTEMLNGIDNGVYVLITHSGTKKVKKGNPMKLYELSYDNDLRLDSVETRSIQQNLETADTEDYTTEASVEEAYTPPAPVAKAPPTAVNAAAKARAAALLSGRKA